MFIKSNWSAHELAGFAPVLQTSTVGQARGLTMALLTSPCPSFTLCTPKKLYSNVFISISFNIYIIFYLSY